MTNNMVLPIVAFTAIASSTLGGLAAVSIRAPHIERPDTAHSAETRALSEKLGALDKALARRDLTRAIYEWRDAYSLALGSRRWDTMVAVGDAAVRIDAAGVRPGGYPTAFRAEARQAYLKALFRARAEHAPEGIVRVADAFAALGDTQMAARARAIAVTQR